MTDIDLPSDTIDPSHRSPAPNGARTRTPLRVMAGLAAIVALALAAPLGWLILEFKGYRNERADREMVRLEMQLGRVTLGASHTVRLEGTEQTVKLLERMAGTPGIETLELIETDLRDQDLQALERLPDLRRLVIAGPLLAGGISEAGLERLSALPLKELELVGAGASATSLERLRSASPGRQVVAKPK